MSQVESALTPQAISNRSGTRLKARFVRGADGTREFRGWFDTQLGLACSFQDYHQVDANVAEICMPNYPVVAFILQPVFRDAECTAEISVVQSAPPRGFLHPSRIVDFTPTTLVLDPSSTVFVKNQDTCVAWIVSHLAIVFDPSQLAQFLSTATVYDVHAVPTSAFVSATLDP